MTYFKTAWRNITKRKAYSFINIGGLAVGIAACLLLFTVVRYELSYDSFEPNYKHIYRVVTQDDFADGVDYTPGIPFPAHDAVKLAFPGITTGALFAGYGRQVTVVESNTAAGKKFIEETGFFFCDPQFFQVFHHNWLAGSPDVLSQPNTTVLTQKMAVKYFGDWKNAVGRFLMLDNDVTVKVEGIIQDSPLNSDFPLGIISSLETAKANASTYGYTSDWGNTTSNFQLYMLLPDHVPVAKINAQFEHLSRVYYKDEKTSKKISFLQPLSELHFDNRFGNFGDHTINRSTLWTLSLIGVFIVIMACINFINLSTAQAVGRSKEIGIRKVLGSDRLQLLGQVMGETFFIVFIALVLAIFVAALGMPYIKHIASIQERLSLLNWQTMYFMLGLIVVVTLFAGLYPALILSGFKPVLALKNKITSATVGKTSLRKGLVVTQFAISQVLIIGTIVAISQMNYVHDADLGFNKEALFIINANADSVMQSRQGAFKQKLLQIPGVQSVSFSSDVPSSDNNWSGNFGFDHKPDEKFNIFRKAGDEDYFKTYGLKIVAGRGFTKSDTANEIVINETLVRKLGIKNPNDVVGKEIRSGRSGWKTIVGVVKDFNTNSLREELKPLMLFARKDRYSVTGVKLRSANISKTQAAIETAWNQYFPEYAYTSSYMDENIARFYQQEDQLSLLYKIFAGIAIFISCLGLYGLVSFMSLQRTKEIGIRKVLGGTIGHILWIFGKEFFILLLVAFLIAAPVAWWIMNNWLQDFQFRIPISPWIFILSILISIVVAAFTVGYRSIRAAIVNPIKSLRNE
ncbi:MAG: ABC transporter permease [Chitinophagaceae bacterium]|nr:ABC transporter permease [Chitinophagaceae bacterium]